MQQLIDINDFMDTLKANGLLIVSAGEFELNNNIRRNKLMKRKALSCAEIISAKLLPLTTNKSIIEWTKTGVIKPSEFYYETTGRKRLMILTAAIKRLGYAD